MTQEIPQTFWRQSTEIVGPARAEEFGSIGQQDTRDAIESFVLQQSHAGTKLLDAGCNTGVEGYRLMRKGYRGSYLGVDSNPRAIAFAMENLVGFQASFSLADLSKIPFPDSSFDIVINKDVIEHAPSYEGILGELARLTKKYLVLSMFIKLNDVQDKISPHPDGYYLNSYEVRRFLGFLASCRMSSPTVIFENSTDQVLLFEKL